MVGDKLSSLQCAWNIHRGFGLGLALALAAASFGCGAGPSSGPPGHTPPGADGGITPVAQGDGGGAEDRGGGAEDSATAEDATLNDGATDASVGPGAEAGVPPGPDASGGPGVDPTTCAQATRIVAQYQGKWSAPPAIVDSKIQTDAPLLGNGDLGVAVLGTIDAMTFALGKNEFWTLTAGKGEVKAMARMALAIPGMKGASYRTSQDLSRAEVDGDFAMGAATLHSASWVQATDTTHNLFGTELTHAGGSPLTASISLSPGLGNTYPSMVGSSGDVLFIDVHADSVAQVGGVATPAVRVAVRVLGGTASVAGGNLTFTIAPGATTTIVAAIMSNYDDAAFQTQAVAFAQAQTQATIDGFLQSHRAWWSSFWCKSFVEIPDKTAESYFYSSLYALASTSRAGESAPGLWGNWVLDNPNWYGDYHLNYNYEVPFLFTLPVNHAELMDNYDKPIIDWMGHGQENAKQAGYQGLYYEASIGPLPNGSTESVAGWSQCCTNYSPDAYMGQKSDASRAAVPMILRYRYLPDATYAARIYPFLKGVATFWQSYLTFDGTRYVVQNDAQSERDAYPQTNGSMSLATVQMLFQACIDISTDLGVDVALRPTWQNILAKLSPLPTFQRNGRTVYRATEVGRDWCGMGSDPGPCVEPIYPVGLASVESDATTLQVASNTVSQLATAPGCNGRNRIFPAEARMGLDPVALLSQIDAVIASAGKPNLTIQYNCGGIENFNTVPATIAEMTLQSLQNKVRVFADWPKGQKARFGDFMAQGAFLVSSYTDGQTVGYVRIVSLRGGALTLVNPWPSQAPVLYRNGAMSAAPSAAADLRLQTTAGETLHLAAAGTTYSQILAMMASPL